MGVFAPDKDCSRTETNGLTFDDRLDGSVNGGRFDMGLDLDLFSK